VLLIPALLAVLVTNLGEVTCMQSVPAWWLVLRQPPVRVRRSVFENIVASPRLRQVAAMAGVWGRAPDPTGGHACAGQRGLHRCSRGIAHRPEAR